MERAPGPRPPGPHRASATRNAGRRVSVTVRNSGNIRSDERAEK
jgi:hypothetical protein